VDPYDRAEAFIEGVAERSEAVGNLRCLAVCHYAHGAMAIVRGDLEEAARSLDLAVELNARIGSPAGVAYAMATRADLRTAAGDLDGGWEAVQQGLEASARASIRDHCLMRNYAAGIRNRVEARDLGRAASLVRQAMVAAAEAGPCSICRPELYGAVASFHLASGSPEDAARWVDRALDLAERGEHRSAVAGALVVRGRIEAARGEPERAGESLRGAADIFGELGYEAELSRTRSLLEDLPTP
jgi:ATP/maltotriose-dependent transcriptional regulator MalT